MKTFGRLERLYQKDEIGSGGVNIREHVTERNGLNIPWSHSDEESKPPTPSIGIVPGDRLGLPPEENPDGDDLE